LSGRVGARVGGGRTAEVFRCGAHDVVKLFYPSVPPGLVEQEGRIAGSLTDGGVPSPRFGGRVRIGDRTGLVYERIDGRTLLDTLSKHPWRVLCLARRMAELHLAIHRCAAGAGLPAQRDALRSAIELAPGLPADVRAAALQRADALLGGCRVCHGDYHPDNVLFAGNDAVAIDWMTASRGSPAGDVARTLMILRHAALPSDTGRVKRLVVGVVRALLAWGYWRRYRAESSMCVADLEPWRLPLFAARLRESIPASERDRLLRLLVANVPPVADSQGAP
jgi:aminoglycoside phosphotransferase (APT) family kinase protein